MRTHARKRERERGRERERFSVALVPKVVHSIFRNFLPFLFKRTFHGIDHIEQTHKLAVLPWRRYGVTVLPLLSQLTGGTSFTNILTPSTRSRTSTPTVTLTYFCLLPGTLQELCHSHLLGICQGTRCQDRFHDYCLWSEKDSFPDWSCWFKRPFTLFLFVRETLGKGLKHDLCINIVADVQSL